MSDPGKNSPIPPTPAETARLEGAQGRTGKRLSDLLGDGAVDASDPNMAQEVTEVADQVHANA